MDIRQMQCFAEVAKAGSFSKAAEVLYVTRQALSKAIGKLEDEVGARLLDIDRRGVRLTPRGQAFLEEITPLLALYEEIDGRYRGPVKRSALEIALGKGTIYPFPEDFLSAFCQANPDVDLHIEEINSTGTLEMVASGEAEIGLLCSHPKYLVDFDTLEILHPGYSVSVPQDSPMASMDHIELENLDGVPFVTLGERNHLHRFFTEQCEKARVRPNIIASTSSWGMLEQARLRASALSFVCTPGFDAPCEAATYVPLRMEGADKFGSYAIRRPHAALSSAAQRFWDHMVAYVEGARRAGEGSGAR